MVVDKEPVLQIPNDLDPAMPFMVHFNCGSKSVVLNFLDSGHVERSVTLGEDNFSNVKCTVIEKGSPGENFS